MSRLTTPIQEARFHPKLRLYLYLLSILVLIGTVVGIAALPVWLFLGRWWARRYYERLECTLGERALVVKKGIQFRTEKTIPLDQIQDVSVRHGPLLNWLGLAKLSVETAGQSGSSQGAAASLIGVVDPIAFRDRVLEQRDRLQDRAARTTDAAPALAGTATDRVVPLLEEIRDTLHGIERALSARDPAP